MSAYRQDNSQTQLANAGYINLKKKLAITKFENESEIGWPLVKTKSLKEVKTFTANE